MRKNGVELDEELYNQLEDMSETLLVWEAESRYDAFTSFSMRKYKKATDIYNQMDELLEKSINPHLSNETFASNNDEPLDLTGCKYNL